MIGGVIVRLKSGVNANSWASLKGFKSIEKMGIPEHYLISSGHGLESLNLANSLQVDVNIISATPNLWQEFGNK